MHVVFFTSLSSPSQKHARSYTETWPRPQTLGNSYKTGKAKCSEHVALQPMALGVHMAVAWVCCGVMPVKGTNKPALTL